MKHPLDIIQPVALQLWNELKPFCRLIKIAGSIRRRCDYCKDIEIVLAPKTDADRNRIGLHLLEHGQIKKGQLSGRYVKAIYRGYPVDLFIPQQHDYWRQLAIRTGSANYSGLIARQWKKKGYVGCDRGLVLQGHENDPSSEPLTWNSEKHFFESIGMKWIHPKDRNV